MSLGVEHDQGILTKFEARDRPAHYQDLKAETTFGSSPESVQGYIVEACLEENPFQVSVIR